MLLIKNSVIFFLFLFIVFIRSYVKSVHFLLSITNLAQFLLVNYILFFFLQLLQWFSSSWLCAYTSTQRMTTGNQMCIVQETNLRRYKPRVNRMTRNLMGKWSELLSVHKLHGKQPHPLQMKCFTSSILTRSTENCSDGKRTCPLSTCTDSLPRKPGSWLSSS